MVAIVADPLFRRAKQKAGRTGVSGILQPIAGYGISPEKFAVPGSKPQSAFKRAELLFAPDYWTPTGKITLFRLRNTCAA